MMMMVMSTQSKQCGNVFVCNNSSSIGVDCHSQKTCTSE